MTPGEAEILRWAELRGGTVTDTALARQFGASMATAVRSLLRHLCLERDRHHLRITTVGEDELSGFDDQSKYAPFEGRTAW